MAKINLKNKFFLLPMAAPILGIISVIVTKALLDLWTAENTESLRSYFITFMGVNFCIWLLNCMLVLLSIVFALTKKISASELAMNLFVNILGSLVIIIFIADKR